MPDVLMLTLHPLPESPPTGDMERWICFGDDKGNSDFDVAYTVLPDENGHSEYTWWAERPVLPAPGDRLTTEHIERVLYEAEGGVGERMGLADTSWSREAMRRLRAALGIKP